jgi:cyclomaltodextrinase / maltogenic alpha-amylase / neopullulanase
MDFAFGTYSNDTLKIANHRAVRTGVQHQHQITPIDPTPADDVIVQIVTNNAMGITHAALYYTRDETMPQGSMGIAQNGQSVSFEAVQTIWDSITWDYLTYWQAVIPAQPDKTMVQYVISAWNETSQEETYADWPDAKEQVQHAAMIHFKNIAEDALFTPHDRSEQNVFNYHVDTIQPPAWAHKAIIYHVFVERFYPGNDRDWLQVDDLKDLCGGTLWGLRDKLDYIADLGVDCIWLSPTWVSPSYHGYDVSDYDRVEPRLGGEDALRAVVEGAHTRGIRVLLDMACNHISNEHPFFVDAFQNHDSPYRDWFFFDDEAEHGYIGFFNVKTMPEVNLDNPQARTWMIDNAVRWLRDFDIDGYRLDYANGPGPNFWSYFRRACKAVKPDCLLFGEIIEPADVLRQYAGRLDGCLDFPINDALRRTFGWQTWTEAQLSTFRRSHDDYFPDGFMRPSFIDNHDMNRFQFIAENDLERVKAAAKKQFQDEQPKVIFYGTEVGLRQTINTQDEGLDVSRVPMVWDDRQDTSLRAFYKALIQEHK